MLNNIRWIWVGIIGVLMLSSCANVFRFEKDNLVAFGEKLNESREPLYYSIRLDLANSVEDHSKSFYLKLSTDSPPMNLTELTPKLVDQYLHPFIPPQQWPDKMKEKIKGQEIYAENGFNISFKNGKLLSVSICSHCANRRENPVVGTSDGQHFYTLPLTEQQVIEVFGSPNRVYKVNEVRY